jgi:predicted N-acetyltransferase YhbS
MSDEIVTRSARAEDVPAISALHALTLGPGRYARTAYRVREGTPGVTRHCRVALQGDRMIAALRMTDILIGGQKGALLLGPLAVEPGLAGRGFGRRLVTEALEDARKSGVALVVLVGDEPYYGRFGFKPIPPGRITLPGPVNPQRLLAAELESGAAQRFSGLVETVR